MRYLAQLLSDGDGNPSTMRVAIFFVLLALLIPNFVMALRNNAPMKVDLDTVFAILVSLGAKVAQKKYEGSGPPPTTPP